MDDAMPLSRSRVNELMAAPPTEDVGRSLAAWADDIPSRVLRGDMMIGILSIEEVELVPAALRKAIECGVAEAAFSLAAWLTAPAYGEAHPDEADAVLADACRRGVPHADLRLARHRWFHRRRDASADEQNEAFDLVTAAVAAHADDPAAQYLSALLTQAGFGTAPSPDNAFQLHSRAAQLGNADAMFELFVYHSQGIGTTADASAAFNCLERAAEAGQPRAMYNLGACYAVGRGVEKNSARAVAWYERAAAVGNISAMLGLAGLLAQGDGVVADPGRARVLLDEAEYLGVDVAELRSDLGL